MPAHTQEVTGELGRYVTLLKKSLEDVRQRLGRVKADIRLENIEAELLTALSAEEQAALHPFMSALNLVELKAERQLLVTQQDALVKAIGLVEAKLNG